jgi:hypothetical protein
MIPGFVVYGGNRCHIARAHDVLTYLLNAVDYEISADTTCRSISTYDDAHDVYKGPPEHSTRDRNAGEFDLDNVACGTYQSYPWAISRHGFAGWRLNVLTH